MTAHANVPPTDISPKAALKAARALAEEHHKYRAQSLNLGCAEALTSRLVREMLATDFARRYGTKGGYAGGRYLDEIELIGENLACRIFGAKYAILSPVTGHVGLMTTLLALTSPGDTFMITAAVDGGYGLDVARRMGLKVVNTVFDLDRCNLDVERTRELILKEKPRLVCFGAPRFLFPHPVKELLPACREVGALVCYDGSHPLGLIAGGQFQAPFEDGADLMVGSTSKTMFGPARGLLLVREDPEIYDKLLSVYRNFLIQSTYQLNGLVALVVALAETMEFGKQFASGVVANSRALAKALSERGVDVLGMSQGGSSSHQVLPRIGWFANDESRATRDHLQSAGILCDGMVRFGTQQLTRAGATPQDMETVAELISNALQVKPGDAKLKKIRQRVGEFAAAHRKLKFTFDADEDAFEYLKLG
jgi:glycine hydroxymethyltransferase